MSVGPLKFVGKRHVELLSHWMGSALIYGTAAGIGVTYYTDWRAVLQYLPYYNGKFPPEEK